MAVMSQVRGTDATGVLYGNSHKNVAITKEVGNAMMFFDYLSKDEMRSMMSIGNNFLCGHVRKATRGKMNVSGAQPFNFINIAGMHNGTLYGDFGEYHTDSEKLLHQLNDKPLSEVLPTLFNVDAAALVWFDKRTKHLHFYHDTLRDLFVAVNYNGSVIYWASEIGILRACLERNGQPYKPFHFQDNTEYVIDPTAVKIHGKEPKVKYVSIKDHSQIGFVDYKTSDAFQQAKQANMWEH